MYQKKLGFDPTDRKELHNALDEYYGPIGSEKDQDLSSDLAIDDKPSTWSKLSLEESEWLHKNHLVAF
ncbi:hypothetical protein [Absicoccus intestinalis]|uniref:Uncharacterized protein n=1 Tax=Absicoccus intestinalis TaxID=2926319 RepID=A0ABU4WMD3_9FIRM|nr:hypothetical protein [Absicoccus sp. CLA-KB-P134]MDX8417710.1 hypothetical protein [Absicoccus sp. CLA-KB-P134]